MKKLIFSMVLGLGTLSSTSLFADLPHLGLPAPIRTITKTLTSSQGQSITSLLNRLNVHTRISTECVMRDVEVRHNGSWIAFFEKSRNSERAVEMLTEHESEVMDTLFETLGIITDVDDFAGTIDPNHASARFTSRSCWGKTTVNVTYMPVHAQRVGLPMHPPSPALGLPINPHINDEGDEQPQAEL